MEEKDWKFNMIKKDEFECEMQQKFFNNKDAAFVTINLVLNSNTKIKDYDYNYCLDVHSSSYNKQLNSGNRYSEIRQWIVTQFRDKSEAYLDEPGEAAIYFFMDDFIETLELAAYIRNAFNLHMESVEM